MSITADVLKPGPGALMALTLALALMEFAWSVPALLSTAGTQRALRAFPRSPWAGRVLALLALCWAAFWLNVMPLGPLSPLKPHLPVLVPLATVAVALLVDELLACRAAGGLMVLLPAPLLSAAQWHPSPWRYVVLVCAYLIAVAGMITVALPYHLRDALHWLAGDTGRLRSWAVAGVVSGCLLTILALAAFRL